MNALRTTFCVVVLVLCARVSADDACIDYSDDRLAAIIGSLALIAERVDASTGGGIAELSLHAGVLRQMSLDADPEALQAACRMVQRFPAIEPALDEAVELLAAPKMGDWLAMAAGSEKGSTRDPALNLNCLTTDEFIGVRVSLFSLRIALNALQAVCDALGCTPDTCIAFCAIARPVVGIITPIFEAGLAVDALHCSTRHAKEMELWCDDSIGPGICTDARAPTKTFVRARNDLETLLLPQLQEVSADVASSDTLEDAERFLVDRFDRAFSRIDTLQALIDADIEGQDEFSDQLRRFDIEVLLAGSASGVPVQFLLPESAGGRIEEVREAVADAIVRTTAAGLEVFDALLFLRQGDAALNQANYPQAFDAYRSAYQETTR